MTKKPKGRKYHHLSARGEVIYYERLDRGKRIRLSCKTANWDEAASFRDLYDQTHGLGWGALRVRDEAPTFGEIAQRYLTEDTGHLAPTTLRDRTGLLREAEKDATGNETKPAGRIAKALGAYRIAEITPAMLSDYWGEQVQAEERSHKTGLCDLDAIGAVFAFAKEKALIERSPVPDFRETLRRKQRTQRGRAGRDRSANIRPIEDPKEIARLIEAARVESEAAHLLVLILLDSGVRLGEALALRWKHVVWGEDESDRKRALLIEQSRSRGGPVGPTKSGRARRVGLSRRLYAALARRYRAAFEPGPEAFVLPDLDPANFRHREWRRILRRAKVENRQMKDLRDTFASQLLSAGVQLGYVSQQLGHSNVAVTAGHYARWCGEGDEYRDPIVLKHAELPADVLARLVGSPPSPPSRRRRGSLKSAK
jgi:integrase